MKFRYFLVLLLLVLLGNSALIYYELADPLHPKADIEIKRTISDVDGFELVHEKFENNQSPFFGYVYAIWADYPFFLYRGEVFERAGAGGVIVRRTESLFPKYLVHEELLTSDPKRCFSGVCKTHLTVSDRLTGEIIAWRTLIQGEFENGHGWEGQHAAEFVRSVLKTSKPIGGQVGTKAYPRAASTVTEVSMSAERHQYSKLLGCPMKYEISNRRLFAKDWSFIPQSSIQAVACSKSYVLIFSYVFPEDIYLDVLSESGKFLWQTELDVPMPMTEVTIGQVSFVEIREPEIRLIFEYWKPENINGNNEYRAFKRFQMVINMPEIK